MACPSWSGFPWRRSRPGRTLLTSRRSGRRWVTSWTTWTPTSPPPWGRARAGCPEPGAMREVRGTVTARGRRFAVVAAQFNEMVVSKLAEGALACLRAHDVAEDDLVLVWVPGAFELPLAARKLAATGRYHGVVCLGAVIRGETAHFDYVAGEAARGIQEAMADTGVPMAFGVLTTEDLGQALDRAGGKHGNKGWDAALAAMQMASVLDQIETGVQGGSGPAEGVQGGSSERAERAMAGHPLARDASRWNRDASEEKASGADQAAAVPLAESARRRARGFGRDKKE